MLLDPGELGAGNGGREVQGTRPERAQLRRRFGHGVILDAVELGGGVVPVSVIAYRDQVRTKIPSRQNEGAIRTHHSRLGKTQRVLRERGAIDGKGRRMREEIKE